MKNTKLNWKKICKEIVITTIKVVLAITAMIAAIVFVVAWSAPM